MTVDEKLDLILSEVSGMKEKLDKLEERQNAVEALLKRNNILLKDALLPKLDIMIEAQQVYEENFPSVRKLKTDVELLKVDVSILKTAVKENVG